MSINTQLFEGKLIRLAPIDHEKDPEVESRWTHDLRLCSCGRWTGSSHFLSLPQLKKRYEAIEKEVDESKRLFHFTIRSKEDGRLVGYVRIEWIEWTHGTGNLKLAIGDPADRDKGYGSEALRLILRYAFQSSTSIACRPWWVMIIRQRIRFFIRHGFVEEVRRRKAVLRDGQTYDLLHLGLLREEWQAVQIEKQPWMTCYAVSWFT